MNQRIRYTISESTLGYILVGAGKSGICAIFLDDHRHRLVEDLRARYPGATLTNGGKTVQRAGAKVRSAVESPGSCGANSVAVAIPCHRIVRRNGSLAHDAR
jgi:6-O-methylguanine DNA methyltransferase, DNA binding domain